MKIVECVANFSEGRKASTTNELAASIRSVDGCSVLDRTRDVDHNRSVITFAGAPDAVSEAAFRAITTAACLIDLSRQSGVHPRVGAADVVPFVPIQDVEMAECVDLAHELGGRVWRGLGIPVYFYASAALVPHRYRLENVRRGEFEDLRTAAANDPNRAPDIGGPELHPTSGAVVIGARKLLIAWNVNLSTSDTSIAREIARSIRESSGGLSCVKALGLHLASRDIAQVSMNLTDFEVTPMQAVIDKIDAEAERRGVEILETEIVGLLPRKALEGTTPERLHIRHFTPDMVLENRLYGMKY